MKIIIVTTENEQMKETGFGLMKSCLSMKEALESNYNSVTIKSCASEQDLEVVALLSPDIVVLAVKYIHGVDDQKIWLSQYFEDAGIIYTGSTREVLEYDSDKILAKNLILKKGIQTAVFTTVTPESLHSKINESIPYPQFIKPLNAANGNGIDDDSVVYNSDDFINKANSLFAKYGNIAISEKYLSGREFTVAVLHNAATNKYTSAPIEIIPPLNDNNIRILGQKVKIEDNEGFAAITNKNERKQLEKMAIKCFKALGVRDFGRVDIKMDEDGVCNFLEVNLVPGMTKGTSYFPICFEMDKQLSYGKIICSVVDNAVSRASVLSKSII
ncbi:MAG: hypothetical protein JEZ08_11770 [Clostridiales bacterium]|nr:hypothetical protein [Clostridiales bacterium]